MPRRIGIYAGTFDPVHAGHIAFALQALKAADLDEIYFLPERKPVNKAGVEHFGHRVAMLNRALKPHPQFKILELVDISFTVKRTLTRLETQFPNDQLVFLLGSDLMASLPTWPHIDRLFETTELVIGVRDGDELEAIRQIIDAWKYKPQAITMFTSFAPKVSSSKVRDALRKRKAGEGVLHSVAKYSNQHWLYVSLENS